MSRDLSFEGAIKGKNYSLDVP